MSTWDVHAGFAPAQNFHPEFGYLCPSAQLRSRVRSTAVMLLVGMAIAGGLALALLPQLVPQLGPQPVSEGVREGSALVAMALPPIDKAAAPVQDGMPAPTLRADPTERASLSRAQVSCDDLSGSFLAPQCQLGKTGKAHVTRTAHAAPAAGHRVATIPIGRPDAGLEAGPREAGSHQAGARDAGPPRAAASKSAPVAETPAAAVAANDASMVPPQKPAAPAKKPVMTVHKQPPNPQVQGRGLASLDTPAAPSPGFDLFALFHQPPRTGNGIWAMQR
jgi:hypothetical protein